MSGIHAKEDQFNIFTMIKPISFGGMLACLTLFSCTNPVEEDHALLKEGPWHVILKLPDADLPFNLNITKKDSAYSLMVINDIEEIEITDFEFRNDSFFISMPVFQSELTGKILSDSSMEGFWHNYSKGKDYKIPVKARHGVRQRFKTLTQARPAYDITGKWEVTFSQGTSDSCKAIGVFKQEDNQLSGTFLTETGDYRFLDGNIIDDSVFLSGFDGSHAFLFKARLDGGALKGQFWSGKHWKESWVAVRNEDFKLTDPDSLTFLKEGFRELSFAFPDLDSSIISLEDEKYYNKAVIVQIMGSWCPNCADETAFLADLYDNYHSKGLEIIALAYEKSTCFEESVKAVKKMKEHFTAEYDFLIAGRANKEEAQKTLPMLNHIMSYPTCIFIDKHKRIRKIRTGFFGPGTGEVYQQNIREMTVFTEQLLNEPI